VHVTFIYDSAGTSGTPKEFFTRLAAGGVEVLEFNPLNPLELKKGWTPNQRNHRKLLIVDGQTAFVGGVNISSVYSAGSFRKSSSKHADGSVQWRDTHLRIEGPVVAEFQKLFLATWAKQKGAALVARNSFPSPSSKGREVVRAVSSSPDEPFSLVYATLISAIGSAETGVHVTNAYFVPDPQLLAALKDAAQRGVDVKLILPAKTDSWLVFHAGRSYFGDLLRAGVKIYSRRDAMLHAKTATIDGVWSTIGSSNLDWRSFLHNEEVMAVVVGQEFGAQMEAMFDADISASDLITLDEWKDRPLGDRARELAARVWKYWL
jgi:cardiolipin synthase